MLAYINEYKLSLSYRFTFPLISQQLLGIFGSEVSCHTIFQILKIS